MSEQKNARRKQKALIFGVFSSVNFVIKTGLFDEILKKKIWKEMKGAFGSFLVCLRSSSVALFMECQY